jgi:MarR family transcriptional regulator, organic hydroperoxide resistance regulator
MGRDDGLAERGLTSRLDAPLSFLRVLWSLGHALERRSKAMERSLGVTGPQRLAVRLVALYPGITPKELAALLCVHPSTLTGIVHRLVDAGFLRREPDPHDGRRARLSVTEAGRGIDGATRGTVESAVREVLAAAAPDDVAGATRLLVALQRALDADQPAAR